MRIKHILGQQRFTTIRTSRSCHKWLYAVKGEKQKTERLMDCISSAFVEIFTSFFFEGIINRYTKTV